MQIERLAPVPLPIEKPITGFQVLNTVAGQATALAEEIKHCRGWQDIFY